MHSTGISKIRRLVAASCLAALFVSAGCSGNSSTENATESTDSTAEIQETDSIAGLPPQKDTVINGLKATTYEFSSVEQLNEFMRKSPNASAYAHGIISTVANASLKYATNLINNPYDYFVVVDKDKMKVILFDKFGRVVKEFGMAGSRNYGTKHGKGDCRTPEGFFSAEGIYDSTYWHYITDSGVVTPGYPFGPKFIRVKNPVTTGVGIHGTSSPGSIGRRVSHGCIRLHNESILELVKYVKPGTPIIILPGPGDRAVNEKEGHPTVFFETGVERLGGATVNANAKASTAKPSAPAQSAKKDSTNVEVQAPADNVSPSETPEHKETPVQPENPEPKQEPAKTEPVNPE